MGKYLQEHLKLHKVSRKWICVFACVVIVIGAIGGITFAKYYANNSNKGVTAAANYYFSSDVLDEAVNKEEQPEEGKEKWKVVYNTDAWDGKNEYEFDVKIRNYQNQLLYNSNNLDISYKITFELLKNDGGTYFVVYGTEGRQQLTVNSPITYERTINGGSAKNDTFQVLFNAPDEIDENYQSAGVKVVAEITGPDYLAKTETKIGGELHVGVVQAEYSLKGEFDFEVPLTDTEWTGITRAVVDEMAAFPYTISYTPGTDNAAHEIQVSWKAEYLQLDQFNENFELVKTNDGISSIQVLIQPKGKVKLTFYRTDTFDLDKLSPTEFQGLITVTDLNESDED